MGQNGNSAKPMNARRDSTLNARVAAWASGVFGVGVVVCVFGVLSRVDRNSIPDAATAGAVALFLMILCVLGMGIVLVSLWAWFLAERKLFEADEQDRREGVDPQGWAWVVQLRRREFDPGYRSALRVARGVR